MLKAEITESVFLTNSVKSLFDNLFCKFKLDEKSIK